MGTHWIKGERNITSRKGKNGGFVVEQKVVRVHAPKRK